MAVEKGKNKYKKRPWKAPQFSLDFVDDRGQERLHLRPDGGDESGEDLTNVCDDWQREGNPDDGELGAKLLYFFC